MTWNSVRYRAAIRSAARPVTLSAGVIAAALLALPASAEMNGAKPLIVNAGPITSEPAIASASATNETLRSDRLAVTVAKIAGANGIIGDAGSDMDIWVGEVEVKGRKTVWVELIDSYGEVIYDAEVAKNETHLLPDGRAIVVRALAEDAPVIAKANAERVETDARLVITRRVVDEGERSTSVEFLEENPRKEPSAMVAVAQFGTLVWNVVAALFTEAVSNVRYAFSWIVNALTA